MIRKELSLPGFELRNLKSEGKEDNPTAITAHENIGFKKLRVFTKGFMSRARAGMLYQLRLVILST